MHVYFIVSPFKSNVFIAQLLQRLFQSFPETVLKQLVYVVDMIVVLHEELHKVSVSGIAGQEE